MTREERLKYCQCCINRKGTSSFSLACSLTGAQATFEDGCKDFCEDPIATNEFYNLDNEKKNSRNNSIVSLLAGLAICCFIVPFVIFVAGVAVEGSYSLFGRMALIIVTFAIIAALMILILYLSRKMRASENKSELSQDDIMKTIQEEGYFPYKEPDGDIVFKIKGTSFTFGTCANGFAYGRLYYKLNEELNWLTIQAAQSVEQSFVAIKVIVYPNKKSLIFSVESLCRDKESFKHFLGRTISILSDSVDHYFETIKCLKIDEDLNDTLINDWNNNSNLQSAKSIKS